MPSGVYKHHSQQGFQKGHHPISGFKKDNKLWDNENSKKTRFKKGQNGENHFRWKGGKRKNYAGYILIYNPNHPFCNKNKCVREQRLVVEKQIGRYLKPEEKVHHVGIKYPIDSIENKQDNRPENLMAFASNGYHMAFHHWGYYNQKHIIFDGRKLTK